MITHTLSAKQYDLLWDKFVPHDRTQPANILLKNSIKNVYNGQFDTNLTIYFHNQKDYNWFLLNL